MTAAASVLCSPPSWQVSAYAAFYYPLNTLHCDAQLIAVNVGKAAGETLLHLNIQLPHGLLHAWPAAHAFGSKYSTAAGSSTCMSRSTHMWIQIFNCCRVFYMHCQKHVCGSKYSTAAGSFTCIARSMCADPSIQLLQGLLHALPDACVQIQVFSCCRVPVFKYFLHAWPAVHMWFRYISILIQGIDLIFPTWTRRQKYRAEPGLNRCIAAPPPPPPPHSTV